MNTRPSIANTLKRVHGYPSLLQQTSRDLSRRFQSAGHEGAAWAARSATDFPEVGLDQADLDRFLSSIQQPE
jgi:hypothetical protein